MADLLQLTTPYFSEFADTPSTDEPSNLTSLLAGDFSALLGGTHTMLQEDEEWPQCKMCGHPLVPYLQINATTTHTPAEFRAHLDYPLSHPDATTLFQVFICTGPGRNGSCLEDWTSGAHPGEAMRTPRALRQPDLREDDREPRGPCRSAWCDPTARHLRVDPGKPGGPPL